MTHILRTAMAPLVAGLTMTACAGQWDEERCRAGGGVWKWDACECSSR